jgi:HUS1 checkpoint protein
MRFKAKLAPEQVSLLHSLIVPLSRLSGGEGAGASSWTRNGSIFYLDKDILRLSCKGKSHDTDGIVCFAELAARGGVFLEHRIESAVENDVIVMELDLVQLRMALKSVMGNDRNHGAADTSTSLASVVLPLEQQYTVLKLAKRQNIPCLCLDACTTGRGSGTGAVIQVHHAIPVRILRAAEWQNHLPPVIPLPDVQLELAPDKPLRTIMDRLRSMSSTVYLEANMTGELTVRIDTDGASIRTFYSKLIPRHEGCKEGATSTTVKVDTKKLCASFQWQQQFQLVSSAVLCLVENEMLVLHASLNPAQVGFFTYYVPVHFLSLDPRDD